MKLSITVVKCDADQPPPCRRKRSLAHFGFVICRAADWRVQGRFADCPVPRLTYRKGLVKTTVCRCNDSEPERGLSATCGNRRKSYWRNIHRPIPSSNRLSLLPTQFSSSYHLVLTSATPDSYRACHMPLARGSAGSGTTI